MDVGRESGTWGLFWEQWKGVTGLVVVMYLVYEQLSHWRKGMFLPGPRLVLPFFGNVFTMVINPTKFWNDQATAAKKVGLSWNVVFGRFIVFVSNSELSHKIFANVRPDAFHLVGHPFGKKLFGENNLIFMFGDEHRDLRRRLAPLFTLKALGVYVRIQECTIRKHVGQWLELAKQLDGPLKIRLPMRNLNLETSQMAFVGPYLTAEVQRQFTSDYNLFNVGLMSLPVNLPGFAYHKATRAVPRLIKVLADCACQSKKRMAAGEEAACLMDFWMLETLKEIRDAEAAGASPSPHSSDHEIGQHIFDFLFAAQDASTSSLVWAAVQLESHPEILRKVREEQQRLRPDPLAPFKPEQLREMKVTEMFVKEVLRFRPPATMVPHIASIDFPITDTYTIPKGTIVFPSLLESSFQGFTDPYTFDPDRFSSERQEDVVYKRNWLLFGAGAHQCLGQRYAMNHLILFTALFSTTVDWQRARTPGCDELLYTPTISPLDEGLLWLSKRPTDSN